MGSRSVWSEFGTWKGLLLGVCLLHYIVWVVTLVVCSSHNTKLFFPLNIYAWSMAQIFYTNGMLTGIADHLTGKAWEALQPTNTTRLPPLKIPTLNVQDFLLNATAARLFLQETYGPNWRERPILLKGLWSRQELMESPRNLTPQGLLELTDLQIPYFSDATVQGALQPDSQASVSTIVQAMLQENKPHKIGSQFIVQHNPDWMDEVAPLDFLTNLLGNHFTKNHLLGNPHRTTWRSWLPGTTTAIVFVANTSPSKKNDSNNDCSVDIDTASGSCPNTPKPAFTGLHCEPIANVAVQLWGSRTWTLVDTEHNWKLKPSISKDGRSFYPSNIDTQTLQTIPRYETTTTPGDAIWLPTWTYHKVDYVYNSDDDDNENNNALYQHNLSIGSSLFHFRPIDYVRRNPLFAALMIPSLLKELAGIKSQ